MRITGSTILTAIASLGIAISGPASASPPAYSVIDLGTLGGQYSGSSGVDDKGQVCGNSDTGVSASCAFLSGACGGGLKNLGTLPNVASSATAVNSKGVVTGDYIMANIDMPQDFITDANGYNTRVLNTPLGYWSDTMGINDDGRVCGQMGNSPVAHAFLSDPNGGVKHDLGTIGDAQSTAIAVNKHGQIAGCFTMPDFSYHALISGQNGAFLRDLGTLNGKDTSAYCINSSGQIAGSVGPTEESEVLISGPNGTALQDVGTLGAKPALGLAINDAGTVVGGSLIPGSFVEHAFKYEHGHMIDLNTLVDPIPGWVLTRATGISNTGFIAVTATNSTGRTHAMLLYPTAPGLAAPTKVTAAGHDATVELHWSGSTGAASYVIYRGTTPGGITNRPLNAGIAVTSYTDTGRKNGVAYYYKIAAENRSGLSPQSAVASATPTP